MLSNNIMDYHVVSQGKTTIPGLDDGEESELTDVRPNAKSHDLQDHPIDHFHYFLWAFSSTGR